MTTLQKTLVAAALIATVGAGLYEARQAAMLREENVALQQQQVALKDQINRLQSERDAATSRLAAVSANAPQDKRSPSELLQLRGQVGALRQEKAAIGRLSGLSKVTADPETRRVMREQQKAGMSSLFSGLAKRLKWNPELTAKFNDLLADDIMESIDQITQALHDRKSRAEIDQVFSAQEQALEEKVAALIGEDGLTQYTEFSRDLGSTITASQFEPNLTGDAAAKAAKKQQLTQAMKEETLASLTAAGLPSDYQTVPMLNFRNIASEEHAELGLKLLDSTFDRVATRANAFLSPEEIHKFQEFRAKAIENNRSMILMNRKMMSPIAP